MKRGIILKTLFLLFFLSVSVTAASEEKNWSVRAGYGHSDKSDLGQILSFQGQHHPAGTSAGGVDAGYLLSENSWGLPLDFYLKGGLNRFFENGYQDDFFEVTFYIKVYWNLRLWENLIRVGLGEGGSYAWGIPYVERLEAQEEGDHNSHFLNYLDISFDIDLGLLLGYAPLEETFLGYALKHRSGIYGTINSVRRGGSNYDMVYIEHNF